MGCFCCRSLLAAGGQPCPVPPAVPGAVGGRLGHLQLGIAARPPAAHQPRAPQPAGPEAAAVPGAERGPAEPGRLRGANPLRQQRLCPRAARLPQQEPRRARYGSAPGKELAGRHSPGHSGWGTFRRNPGGEFSCLFLLVDMRSAVEGGSIWSDNSIKKEDHSSHSSTCVVDTTTKGDDLAGWRGEYKSGDCFVHV